MLKKQGPIGPRNGGPLPQGLSDLEHLPASLKRQRYKQQWGVPMGPSLVDLHAHRDIHDAARTEMEVGTELLQASLSGQGGTTALRLAQELLSGWRQRVLAHAEAEEQDVFPLVLERLPEQRDAVAALIRDHELMRLLVDETERDLAREGRVTGPLLERFTALLHIQRLHALSEEETFLPQVQGALAGTSKRSEGGR